MTKNKQHFMGDALTQRPTQKTRKYKRQPGMATTLDGVNVQVSSSTAGGTYASPTLHGVEFDRMRRYALVLAKWSMPDVDKKAKQWHLPVAAVQMANRVVANLAFSQVFGEDPTEGTVNITPYVGAFANKTEVKQDLMCASLGLLGTKAFDNLLKGIKTTNPDAHAILSEVKDNVVDSTLHMMGTVQHINHPRVKYRRHAENVYQRIARYGVIADERYRSRTGTTKPGSGKGKTGQGKPGEPSVREGHKTHSGAVVRSIDEYNDGSWQPSYLAKHPLVLPHTGKAGRRMIATNEGKYPKMFHRLVTDPYQRIFQRKSRALGGVVVIDCSGSMSLSDEDIKKVMRASAGCSIVCYSGGVDDPELNGNIHLVARHGRQMRGLPYFPGDNGVDLPALKWSYFNLRLNSKSPVVWVSDGQVTGIGDVSNRNLRVQTEQFIKQKHIVQVGDVDAAIKLLSQLQQRRMK